MSNHVRQAPLFSVASYRQDMVLALEIGLADAAGRMSGSSFDAYPIAEEVVSFLPLPASVCKDHLCQLVGHTNLAECQQYGRELLNTGLRMGTLAHLVRIEGNSSFWCLVAPRKPWRRQAITKGSRLEAVWEHTPVLHAGVHLVITVEEGTRDHLRGRSGVPSVLFSRILEDELQAGHFVCLREWFNELLNCQGHDDQGAVQALLEVEHYSAEQVRLKVVCHPHNSGDHGFWIKPTSTLVYRKGWVFQAERSEIEWLREVWDMFVKPISPWNDKDQGLAKSHYCQFWQPHMFQVTSLDT